MDIDTVTDELVELAHELHDSSSTAGMPARRQARETAQAMLDRVSQLSAWYESNRWGESD